jgi:hypothetical protein
MGWQAEVLRLQPVPAVVPLGWLTGLSPLAT